MRFMFITLIAACSTSDRSSETLKKAGYSDIETTGWAPLTCSNDDTYSTGFVATNPAGDKVDGVVCCGLLTKNCTIRF